MKVYYSAKSATAAESASAITRRVWSPQETQTLQSAVERGLSRRQCTELLPGRTMQAVANQLALRNRDSRVQRQVNQVRSSDVNAIVRLARQGLGKDEIQERMHHRSKHYIVTNAYTHGIYFARKETAACKRWTADEDELLSQPAGHQTLIEAYGRSLEAINRMRKYLKQAGSTADLPKKPWTAEDVQTAFDKYTSGVPFSDIAKALGRSLGSVTAKAYEESRRLHGPKLDHHNSQSLRTHKRIK